MANRVHWVRWDEAEAERGIDRVFAFFRERGLPFVWSVGPSTRPPDLGARLLARGFVRETDALLLAARLPIVGLRTNPQVRVVPVVHEEMALVATRLEHEAWDGDRLRAFAKDLFERIAAGSVHAVAPYIAEQPVATARWRIHADLRVVHLSGAWTSPAHRRKGAYSTLVAHRARHGQERGCQYATIVAEPLALRADPPKAGLRDTRPRGHLPVTRVSVSSDAVKFYLHTLGCAKNLVDAEEMASRLIAAGDVAVARPEDADVLVLNTCGFIGPARDESVAAARELAGLKRRGQRLVVAGCLSEREPDLVRAVRGVDVVLGTKRIAEIGAACHEGLPTRPALEALDLSNGWRRVVGGSRAYVKIADGCDHVCTFCTIPSFKGPLRSKPLSLILAEAELLLASGTKELVLIAQDSTDYGHDLRDGTTLATLLRALDKRARGHAWVRVMYAYPHHVSEALLAAMAECSSVVPYLGVPLQHAHRATLRRMKRGGSPEFHLTLLERIRRAIPDVTLRSTFIVGFPGETEEEFGVLLEFLRAARIDRAGFFEYSRERGTPAGEMDQQVPDDVKADRLARAQAAQERIGFAANRAAIGRTLDVLVARQERIWAIGRSVREAPDVDGEVHVRCAGPLPAPGSFVRARVNGAGPSWLRATLA